MDTFDKTVTTIDEGLITTTKRLRETNRDLDGIKKKLAEIDEVAAAEGKADRHYGNLDAIEGRLKSVINESTKIRNNIEENRRMTENKAEENTGEIGLLRVSRERIEKNLETLSGKQTELDDVIKSLKVLIGREVQDLRKELSDLRQGLSLSPVEYDKKLAAELEKRDLASGDKLGKMNTVVLSMWDNLANVKREVVAVETKLDRDSKKAAANLRKMGEDLGSNLAIAGKDLREELLTAMAENNDLRKRTESLEDRMEKSIRDFDLKLGKKDEDISNAANEFSKASTRLTTWRPSLARDPKSWLQ